VSQPVSIGTQPQPLSGELLQSSLVTSHKPLPLFHSHEQFAGSMPSEQKLSDEQLPQPDSSEVIDCRHAA